MTTATTRAVTYSRYSSDQQRESSITDQQRNCNRRADQEKWTIKHHYADHAISGSDSSRPEYQQMIKAAMRGDFQVLVIDDLSRLTRDSMELERTIRRLEFTGIRIVTVSDGYDSTSKARKVLRAVNGMRNEMFLDDLAAKVHRGQAGQALKGYWNGGRPFGYKLKAITDPSQRDAYGAAAQIGTRLEIYKPQAKVVREIFDKFIAGQSHRAIAADLNARGVPSAGTTWARKKHRASGWMGSAIRVILRNALYVGEMKWNQTKFIRDPNTERVVRRKRPKSEWIIHQDESLRIISDATFSKAAARTKVRSNSDERLKAGGKAKYLLSGLLKCSVCGGNFIFADAKKYACSTYVNGGASACANKTRVRRDVLEREIIGPIKDELLDPDRIKRMAAQLQKQFNERVQSKRRKGVDAPRELTELDARLDRLRTRLRTGDPDMEADEIAAAIDRAQTKRQQLAVTQTPAGSTAKVLSMLPKAAESYRRQIVAGLDANPEAAAKARTILRELIGMVTIKTEGATVWGEFEARPGVLLRAADTDGRGDRI